MTIYLTLDYEHSTWSLTQPDHDEYEECKTVEEALQAIEAYGYDFDRELYEDYQSRSEDTASTLAEIEEGLKGI